MRRDWAHLFDVSPLDNVRQPSVNREPAVPTPYHLDAKITYVSHSPKVRLRWTRNTRLIKSENSLETIQPWTEVAMYSLFKYSTRRFLVALQSSLSTTFFSPTNTILRPWHDLYYWRVPDQNLKFQKSRNPSPAVAVVSQRGLQDNAL